MYNSCPIADLHQESEKDGYVLVRTYNDEDYAISHLDYDRVLTEWQNRAPFIEFNNLVGSTIVIKHDLIGTIVFITKEYAATRYESYKYHASKEE